MEGDCSWRTRLARDRYLEGCRGFKLKAENWLTDDRRGFEIRYWLTDL
jgi:hypothetical protein